MEERLPVAQISAGAQYSTFSLPAKDQQPQIDGTAGCSWAQRPCCTDLRGIHLVTPAWSLCGMGRPHISTCNTRNRRAGNKALTRRGSLTVWFDPDMAWAAKPTGKRGRQSVCSAAAVQTCLTMKVLFGMALGQTTGVVESLLRRAGLDWGRPLTGRCRISAPSAVAGRRWP